MYALQAMTDPCAFEYMDYEDLLALPYDEDRYLCDGLLMAAGSSLVVAQPKDGKTTLTYQLTRTVSTGGTFLGRSVHQGLVLCHYFEEEPKEVAESYRKGLGYGHYPIKFHFGSPPEDRENALRRSIELFHPSLVILDTLAYWADEIDFNDYRQVGQAVRPLHTMARELQTHIMVVHHAGKSGATGGITSSPLGSIGLVGAVDTLMYLSRMDPDQEDKRVIETRQRYGYPFRATIIDYNRETRGFILQGTAADVQAAEYEQRLLTCLGVSSLSDSEIKDRTKIAKESILKTLNSLMEKGLIRCKGQGHSGSPFTYYVIQGPHL